MWKLGAPVLVLLVLLVASVLSDRPEPKADFVFVNRGDVATLDPVQMSWMQDLRVARLLFEGLTREDVFSPGYDPMPAAAERWEISDDRRTYTFFLRRGAEWSDGTPVTAQDFVAAWRRVLLPDNGGDYAKLIALIRGGSEFIAWRLDRLKEFAARSDLSGPARRDAAEALWRETLSTFDEVVGVKAANADRLVVELERPTPYFLGLTAFPCFYPLPRALLAGHESIDPRTGRVQTDPAWTRPGRLVCNGPFVLTRWRFKRDMRFAQNPRYRDRASLNIRTIDVPSIGDGNTQVLAFDTGAVDWVSDVTPTYRGDMLARKREFRAGHAAEVAGLEEAGVDPVEIDRRLPRDPRATIHAFPTFGTTFFNFNCSATLRDGRANPFHDARVRRAFALAIDKRAIVRDVRRSEEPVAGTLIPPGSLPGYTSPRGLGFDPERARAELSAAGFPGGAGFPRVEILVNSDSGLDVVALAAAADWRRHLGVDARPVLKERIVFRQDLKNANYMISSANWFGDYADPTTFLDLSRTGDGNNDRKYSSPAYDALMDRARDERDAGERMRLLTAAERMIVEEDLPILPLYQAVQIYQFDAHRVTGISPHPLQVQYLARVDILGDGIGREEPVAMHAAKR